MEESKDELVGKEGTDLAELLASLSKFTNNQNSMNIEDDNKRNSDKRSNEDKEKESPITSPNETKLLRKQAKQKGIQIELQTNPEMVSSTRIEKELSEDEENEEDSTDTNMSESNSAHDADDHDDEMEHRNAPKNKKNKQHHSSKTRNSRFKEFVSPNPPILHEKRKRNAAMEAPSRYVSTFEPTKRQKSDPRPPSTTAESKMRAKNQNVKQSPEKLSFQEAAIKVLADQRLQGVHALSTRNIWELIMQSDLVDTKCKTPISSLSSRITEDVRTKGNKSVFVRVGEGLYALRKGMKKQELDSFLASHYPNLEKFNEEQMGDFDNFPEPTEPYSGHDVESRDERRSTSRKRKEGFKDSKEEEIRPADGIKLVDAFWVGLPLKTKCGGEIYYSSIRIKGHRYAVGDCAYFSPNSDDQSPYVGQITKLWQSKFTSGDLEAEKENMFVKCVWYFYPEDTHVSAKKFPKREMFLSDLSDVNHVSAITAPVVVLSFGDYNRRLPLASKIELKRMYFCRSFYSELKQEFIPFKASEVGQTIIELEHGPILPPNWPADVLYTSNVVWRVSEGYRDYFHSKIDLFTEIRQSRDGEQGKVNERTGLFSTRYIKNGTILGEFTGYIGLKEIHDGTSDVLASDSQFIHKLYQDDQVIATVDATTSGNEYRFLRKCGEGQEPNVRLVPIWTSAKWHLVVFTTKDVQKSEELLFAQE